MIGNWWYDIDSDNILNCPRSNYYFLTQLNQLLDNTTSKCLSMFHCNIRSIPKHLSLVNEFLHSVNRKPDILAITETRLSNRTVTNVDILNYDFFHTNPPKQTSGSGLYVQTILLVIYLLLLLNLKLCFKRQLSIRYIFLGILIWISGNTVNIYYLKST